jgi:hypothetical protein
VYLICPLCALCVSNFACCGHGDAVPLRAASFASASSAPLRPLRLCVTALCVSALCVTVLAWWARRCRAPTGGVLGVRVLRDFCLLWARRCRAPTGGGLCVSTSAPLRPLRRCVTVLCVTVLAWWARRWRAPTGDVLGVRVPRDFCLFVGTAMPCPYGRRPLRQHPLRLCALCVSALCVSALCVSALCVTVLAWWARRWRAPTGGVLGVRVLRDLCLFVGTAMACPYGRRSGREGPSRLVPFCGHGDAVPLRVASCASASSAPLRPLRLCVSGLCALCAFALASFALSSCHGGTASPCPYGRRPLRQHPLRLCVLCAFALAAFALAPFALKFLRQPKTAR